MDKLCIEVNHRKNIFYIHYFLFLFIKENCQTPVRQIRNTLQEVGVDVFVTTLYSSGHRSTEATLQVAAHSLAAYKGWPSYSLLSST